MRKKCDISVAKNSLCFSSDSCCVAAVPHPCPTESFPLLGKLRMQSLSKVRKHCSEAGAPPPHRLGSPCTWPLRLMRHEMNLRVLATRRAPHGGPSWGPHPCLGVCCDSQPWISSEDLREGGLLFYLLPQGGGLESRSQGQPQGLSWVRAHPQPRGLGPGGPRLEQLRGARASSPLRGSYTRCGRVLLPGKGAVALGGSRHSRAHRVSMQELGKL